MIYRNWFELEACLRMSPLKWDISQPSKMFIAREMLHKSRQYQIYRYHIDQILEIWYPILFCLYLSSLILYRKVFVLQTELWISPFKWVMSQTSSMFVAREIKRKLKRKFSEVFFGTPFTILAPFRSYSASRNFFINIHFKHPLLLSLT